MKKYSLIHTEMQDLVKNDARWSDTEYQNLSEQEAYELRVRLMQSDSKHYYKMIKQ